MFQDIPYEWVWEIKCIKKGDAGNEEILKSKRQEASGQLERYRHSPLFSERTNVKYASILFIGKDKYECKTCNMRKQK